MSGELYLGGAGLARGYLNQPQMTADRFVAVNLLGQAGLASSTHLSTHCELSPSLRLYKTGDRVRYRPDGSLEFLGRFDHQVKIRGFRIELGEIETVLRQHPSVEAAVVIAHGDTNTQLVAYVVSQEISQEISQEASTQPTFSKILYQYLANRLPAYLLPTLWVELPALPQLPNGKN